MQKIKDFLSGYRTYLIAAAAGVVVAAHAAGLIDAATHQHLLEFLGVGAVVTMRAAVAKIAA